MKLRLAHHRGSFSPLPRATVEHAGMIRQGNSVALWSFNFLLIRAKMAEDRYGSRILDLPGQTTATMDRAAR